MGAAINDETSGIVKIGLNRAEIVLIASPTTKPNEIIRQLKSVTVADIKRVARKYLVIESAHISVIGKGIDAKKLNSAWKK